MIAKGKSSRLAGKLLCLTSWIGLTLFAVATHAGDGMTTQIPEGMKWVDCGEEWPKGCQAAWIAGDASKETSFWFVRAPKGAFFARHSHTGAERIVALRGRITGATDSGNPTTIAPGSYLGFDGKSIHWARCEDDCLMFIVHDGIYDQFFH